MNRTQFLFILLMVVAASCSRTGTMQRDQQQYDVVEEGSADGVASTLNAPGETAPTITDTSVDTTTAFTVPGTTTTTGSQPPETIASSLPDSTGRFPGGGYVPPRPRPKPAPPPTTMTDPPMTSASTDTAAPPPPTTTDTVAPLTATDTTATSTQTTTTTPPAGAGW